MNHKRDGQRGGADQKEIFELASELFDRLSYRGDDAKVIWQVATLVWMGKVSRAVAIDATNAVRACSPVNPIPYFVRCVLDRCPDAGQLSANSKRILKFVPLPAGWSSWRKSPPPKPEPSQKVLDLVGTFKRPPAKTSDGNGMRDQLRELLEAEAADRTLAEEHACDPPYKPM